MIDCCEPEPALRYLYSNRPDMAKADRDMKIHGGTAFLVIGNSSLRGEYYTDQLRKSWGTLEFTKAK